MWLVQLLGPHSLLLMTAHSCRPYSLSQRVSPHKPNLESLWRGRRGGALTLHILTEFKHPRREELAYVLHYLDIAATLTPSESKAQPLNPQVCEAIHSVGFHLFLDLAITKPPPDCENCGFVFRNQHELRSAGHQVNGRFLPTQILPKKQQRAHSNLTKAVLSSPDITVASCPPVR